MRVPHNYVGRAVDQQEGRSAGCHVGDWAGCNEQMLIGSASQQFLGWCEHPNQRCEVSASGLAPEVRWR